jgi:hypothetical protein
MTMMKVSYRRVVAALSPLLLAGAVVAPASAQTGQFDGVNWADPRDNFADDALVLSGLAASDSYATVRAKSVRVAAEFYTRLGANTVRIPINPATVNGSSWAAYRGVIDGIRAQGARVIIAYWEGTDRDGRIDDRAAFDTMWGTVVNAYASDAEVYFEPMNEPHGYSLADWSTIAASWVSRFSSLPRGRMVIDGQGYSEDVKGVCADSRFNGTLLGVHNYAFWANRSYDQWVADWRNKIGSCGNRTVITEFGATMSSGYDYGAPSNINEVMYIQAAARVAREQGMGAVYWPGLRDNDTYAMTTRSGSGTDITLTVVNASGRNSLREAWGF